MKLIIKSGFCLNISLFLLTTIIYAQNSYIPKDKYGNIPNLTGKGIHVNNEQNNEIKKTWTLLGPNGGDVMDIATCINVPATLYAATGVLFKSTDAGEQWQAVESITGTIGTVEVDSNGVVYASGMYEYGKIYKSTNNGSNWLTKTIPVNAGVNIITIDPNSSSTIYAGLTANSIIKSTNSGNNWSVLNISGVMPAGYSVIEVSVSSANSQLIYAIGGESFSNRIVIASTDGGINWEDKTGNIPSGGPCNKIKFSGQNIYILGGQLFGSAYFGVYKSTDNGTNWEDISTSFPIKIANDLLIDPNDGNKMYAGIEGGGIYYTTNGGALWSYSTNGALTNSCVRSLAFEYNNYNNIYAGCLSLAVCKSTDAGKDWTFANKGIANLLINDVEVDVNNPLKILASFEAQNSGGCYLSNDGGENWSLVTGLPLTRYKKVGFGADGALYAGSNGPSSIAQEGIYKSTDGGVTWNNMGPNVGPYFETEILSMSVSPSNPNLIYIGGNNFGVNGYASIIYKTTNGGQTWDNVYIGNDNDSFRFIYIEPSNEQIVYAAFYSDASSGGFMKSTDAGINWGLINTDLPTNAKLGSVIVSDSHHPEILYGGIGGNGDIAAKIYKSTNAGENWIPTSMTTTAYSYFTDILVSPTDSNVIYVSSIGNGVSYSTNTGSTWAVNNGLPTSQITGLSRAFMHNGALNFCASTYNMSTFISDIYTGSSVPNTIMQDSYLRVYPVPGNGASNIYLKLDKPTETEVRICNSLGQTMQILISKKLNKGNYQYKFSGEAGIYYIQAILDGQLYSTKKIIIN